MRFGSLRQHRLPRVALYSENEKREHAVAYMALHVLRAFPCPEPPRSALFEQHDRRHGQGHGSWVLMIAVFRSCGSGRTELGSGAHDDPHPGRLHRLHPPAASTGFRYPGCRAGARTTSASATACSLHPFRCGQCGHRFLATRGRAGRRSGRWWWPAPRRCWCWRSSARPFSWWPGRRAPGG